MILGSMALFSMAGKGHKAGTSEESGMVWIPEGRFEMGCGNCQLSDALPLHRVDLSGFWMDQTPVTNREFKKFVRTTGYRTVAERPLQPKDYPDVPPDKLVSGSAVFAPPERVDSLDDALQWWRYVAGASWQHPEGPSTQIDERWDHPVVHIAYSDAAAYCAWAGKRLPTEAEYEYAARGGLKGKRYAWGDELKPGGRWPANIWQGKFPSENSLADGFARTSPVRSFPPNGYGLYDISGNVWHWTADWYRPDTYARDAAQGIVRNPQGPDSSLDPSEPNISKRVQRGGSFLCSDHYCTRYLVGSRGKGAVDSAGSNVGFRCVKSGS
jgi:formylglycine-generating enzyme required for sulfatase activity